MIYMLAFPHRTVNVYNAQHEILVVSYRFPYWIILIPNTLGSITWVIKCPHWTSPNQNRYMVNAMATFSGDVQYSQNGTVTNPWLITSNNAILGYPLVICYIAIENGSVEIVDFPSYTMVFQLIINHQALKPKPWGFLFSPRNAKDLNHKAPGNFAAPRDAFRRSDWSLIKPTLLYEDIESGLLMVIPYKWPINIQGGAP